MAQGSKRPVRVVGDQDGLVNRSTCQNDSDVRAHLESSFGFRSFWAFKMPEPNIRRTEADCGQITEAKTSRWEHDTPPPSLRAGSSVSFSWNFIREYGV